MHIGLARAFVFIITVAIKEHCTLHHAPQSSATQNAKARMRCAFWARPACKPDPAERLLTRYYSGMGLWDLVVEPCYLTPK
jgi:hypothetical protein